MMGPPGWYWKDAPGGARLPAKLTFHSSRSPVSDFVEMFVGGWRQSRWRDLFRAGQKRNAPCIIFIDENRRGWPASRARGLGWRSRRGASRTLNQLLVEMDGFESNDGVILIASTNRPDVLDPALAEAGPVLDRRVVVQRPDRKGPRGNSRRPHSQDPAAG